MNPRKQARSLLDQFKHFTFKGNVVDLSLGVIIGGAFGKIVDSFVKHIVMPTISVFLPSEQSYLGWKIVVHSKEIPYGLFISEVVNFLLVSFFLFIFIFKFLGWVMHSKNEEAKAPPALSKDQELLIEIRDLLKKSGS